MKRRLRWRRAISTELASITERLAAWPVPVVGGAARHQFALATIESQGADPIRVVEDERRWAMAVVFPGRLVVPCGDASAIAAAAAPTKRWRLLVGDLAAGDAVLARTPRSVITDELIVHDQRFMTADSDLVPAVGRLADPGLRRAELADLDRLADLAVQLHVDDQFGPHPGVTGWRGYRQRLATTIRQGMVWCVGPLGGPIAKLERSVSSHRWGVQLAGIVVSPSARHEGLGRAMVAAAVREALVEVAAGATVSLHVRSSNARAIGAYLAAGFVDREAWRLAVRP